MYLEHCESLVSFCAGSRPPQAAKPGMWEFQAEALCEWQPRWNSMDGVSCRQEEYKPAVDQAMLDSTMCCGGPSLLTKTALLRHPLLCCRPAVHLWRWRLPPAALHAHLCQRAKCGRGGTSSSEGLICVG